MKCKEKVNIDYKPKPGEFRNWYGRYDCDELIQVIHENCFLDNRKKWSDNLYK